MRCNVDLLRIIQLGFAFMDEDGKTPPGYSAWQFNFKFNLSEDTYAQDSIELLQHSGILFEKHAEDGIDPLDFAELLMSSGIVLMEDIKFLCFHSGNDFGYLLKLLTDQKLPPDESEFYNLLGIYFPKIYDVKHLMKSCKNLSGGLQEVADQLKIGRIGPHHQAGADAWLTGMAFFKIRELEKNNKNFSMEPTSIFLDYALEQGFDYVATGHYARRMDTPQGAFILRGRDPNKDQSYFLSLMRPDQIARAVFPLGDLLKPEVRVLAEKYGLPTARKKDSQGICFIGQVKMSDFLRHYLPDKPGKIVDTEGRTLGTHNGLHLFTMGQRKGHGVASPREGVAYVVVGKDVQRNRLILGYEDASTRGLYASRAVVGGISNTLAPLPSRVMAQPRYRAKAEWASCEYLEEGKVRLGFDTPLRALAVGQVCAFYDGGKLLGGGFFESIEP